tara:strand:- start:210 stop:560 length:351 start_codon:yes stop_codon:yes gene_type:complete
MSDEIIDVNAKEVVGPSETTGKDGINIPDPDIVSAVDSDDMNAIHQARKDAAALPEFPSEWQNPMDVIQAEGEKGFDSSEKVKVNVSLKEKEIQKIIKKYKRYMKSNIREVNRLDS